MTENKDSFRIEVEFPRITYYNIGLAMLETFAKTRIAALYGMISTYSMPFITAIALYLMIWSLVVLLSNESSRQEVIGIGLEGLSISPSNPYIPWDSPISYGFGAYLITLVVSDLGRGIVARVYSIRIESSGISTMIGIIPTNSFLNIDKEHTSKLPLKVKSAIYTASPLSNIIVAGLSLGLLYLVVITLVPSSSIDEVQNGVRS